MSLSHFKNFIYEEKSKDKPEKAKIEKQVPSSEDPKNKTNVIDIYKKEQDETKIENKDSMSQYVKDSLKDYQDAVLIRMELVKDYVNIKPTDIVKKRNVKAKIESINMDLEGKKAQFLRLFYDEDYEFFDKDNIEL